jgi:hypothetical protein
MRLRRGGSCSVGIVGPRLSMSITTAPSNGAARIEDQRIHYDARPGFVGDDTFTVRMFSPDRSQNNTSFVSFRVQVRDTTPPLPPPSPDSWRAAAGAKAPSQPGAARTATPATRPTPQTQPQTPAAAASQMP